MKYEIIAFMGYGNDKAFQFGGASLLVDGVEKSRIVQKSTTLTLYALAYMGIEEVLKSYDCKIDNLIIIEQSDMGLKGSGQGKMKHYIENLKNNVLNGINWEVKKDSLRCQKIRDQITKKLPNLEEDIFYTLPIGKQAQRQCFAEKSSIKENQPARMTTIFQKANKKTLHSNATTWKGSIQTVTPEIIKTPTTSVQNYNMFDTDKEKLKYACFSNMKERFQSALKKESKEIQQYCDEAMLYLSAGCVLKNKRKFKDFNEPLGAENYIYIAENLKYSQLKDVANSLIKQKPNKPMFYALAVFAKLQLKAESLSKTENITGVIAQTGFEPPKSRVLQKYEDYQPKKKVTSHSERIDYTAFGQSRYIKVTDRRVQVMCSRFDELPENIKTDIYRYFKSKADIDFFTENKKD